MEDLFEISFLTLLVCREINHCLSKKALRLGLTPLELQVLWAVVRSGEATTLELARLVASPKVDVESTLITLEADGLVTKRYAAHSHMRLIGATNDGEALIRSLPACRDCGCALSDLQPEAVRLFVEQAYQLVSVFRGSEIAEQLRNLTSKSLPHA